MRIALFQQRHVDDEGGNLRAAESAIRSAAQQRAEIVCLQELFMAAYFPRRESAVCFDLAEDVPGPTTEYMQKLARELSIVLIVPIFERRAPGMYHNSALVIDADGALAGHYRKMHLPDDPGFSEKFYFSPGDRGFFAVDTAAGRIAVLICWDQWFPEAARLVALDGAEVIFYPSAIGWVPDENEAERAASRDAWITVQRSHAIANGTYVAAANRVGREGQIEFYGSSFVCDPRGVLLAEASSKDPELLLADCPRAAIEHQRRGWPFLRDRRFEAYGDLARQFRRR
ncbi:MAG: carbon-nitrogen hydrolase [Myxococcales bacterium]|nr:carbon-nitrogen hydrolase [Myxococcales bacterium]